MGQSYSFTPYDISLLNEIISIGNTRYWTLYGIRPSGSEFKVQINGRVECAVLNLEQQIKNGYFITGFTPGTTGEYGIIMRQVWEQKITHINSIIANDFPNLTAIKL